MWLEFALSRRTPKAKGLASMLALSLCSADFIQEDDCQEENVHICSDMQMDVFNMWFSSVIKTFSKTKVISKDSLSMKEVVFIKTNNLEKSVDCCYALLNKYTMHTFDEQISMVLNALQYLSDMRIPKEYAGGFLILICKYYFLP